MVFHQGGYILFGGYIGGTERTSTIARFDESTRKWSKWGNLLTPRSSHGVIYTVESFLVIGGSKSGNDEYKLRTEQCDIKTESLSCYYHSSTLEYFYRWPSAVLVNDTFGQ